MKLHSYQIELILGMLVMFLFLAKVIGRTYGWLPAVAFAYFCLNALPRIVLPLILFKGFQIEVISGFESIVAESLVYMLLIVFFFCFLGLKDMSIVLWIFSVLALSSTIVMAVKMLAGQIPFMLFNNPAINVAFISCMLPFFLNRVRHPYQWAIIAFMWFICIISQTSSGILGVGLSTAAYLWASHGFKKKSFLIGSLIALAIGGAGYLTQKEMLFNSSGRLGVWALTMKFWWNEGSIWFGQGAGTFQIYGPAIQMAEAVRLGVKDVDIPGFFWMHNDWLQVLFETGVIGFGLVLSLYLNALWRLRNTPAVWASLITFGAMAFIQMPLRHIIFTSLGAYLMIFSFRTHEERDANTNDT